MKNEPNEQIPDLYCEKNQAKLANEKGFSLVGYKHVIYFSCIWYKHDTRKNILKIHIFVTNVFL